MACGACGARKTAIGIPASAISMIGRTAVSGSSLADDPTTTTSTSCSRASVSVSRAGRMTS